MNVVSLFCNIGVAEAYLEDLGFRILLASDSVERRLNLYSKIYPKTKTICGDFSPDDKFNEIKSEKQKKKIDLVMATPPCQGMSTAGQQRSNDERNDLIIPTIKFIKELRPKYVFLENVPQILKTEVIYNGKSILISELISQELGRHYSINTNVVEASDYSVPQSRERAIILMSRNNASKIWDLPTKDPNVVTVKDAIGDLPSLSPFIKDVNESEMHSIFPDFQRQKEKALEVSKWHIPPQHVKRQVFAMMHTPTGRSAFENENYKPKKQSGEIIKGFKNTYKRQEWDRPAFTITMDNVKISSQNNVHPGRFLGLDSTGGKIYSDPRALTFHEIMTLMTLPSNWPIPANASVAFLRRVCGEGIPPLLVKKIFKSLLS